MTGGTGRAATEAELADVRERLRATAWGYPTTGAKPFAAILVTTILLGAVAALGLLLAVLALLTGDPAVAAVFGAAGGFVGVPALLAGRAAVARQRPANLERTALLRRERELVARITADSPMTGWTHGDERQPSPYAQLMWARFRIGPPPEEALRRLPPDAPAWLVTFHRSIGWGLVTAVCIASTVLVTYAALVALR